MDIVPPGDVLSITPVGTAASPDNEADQMFPPELIQLILEFLRHDLGTLKRTSLVCTQWLPISRTYLFDHIYLSAPRPAPRRRRTDCSALYEVLSEAPHIALYIRHVTILSGAVRRPSIRTISSELRWITSDETLPALLDIFAKSDAGRVQSLHIRLSGESWDELPVPLRTSIRSLINSPSLLDVDLTGFDVIDWTIFERSPNLRRVKLSEIFNAGPASQRRNADLVPKAGSWPARCESLTVLDTGHVASVISWVIDTPSFGSLRELRLGFHPSQDVPHVEALLRHISGTLESLHLQPIYNHPWPVPAHFIDISSLRALTSLRLSLGLSVESNPFPWVIFLLNTLGPIRITHLTIDLRVNQNRIREQDVLVFPWDDLDASINQPHLAGLRSLVFTCFAYQSQPSHSEAIADWLKERFARLLPRSRARDVFEAYELKLPPSRFFYWPGPLTWSDSLGAADTA
ncbi:hypothetical protein DFH07DRAFT_966834 [Mycena maculata]|uniref:F-box domain-containing protein n=1 Tax=Mycena maculata TaxID=230809 RepID=A0AAD7I762_9AGAR|nr:hypothetical protein DFH07DRAFT_966834 [Mycena maculata]